MQEEKLKCLQNVLAEFWTLWKNEKEWRIESESHVLPKLKDSVRDEFFDLAAQVTSGGLQMKAEVPKNEADEEYEEYEASDEDKKLHRMELTKDVQFVEQTIHWNVEAAFINAPYEAMKKKLDDKDPALMEKMKKVEEAMKAKKPNGRLESMVKQQKLKDSM